MSEEKTKLTRKLRNDLKLELQISYPENQNSSSNCKYSFNNKVIDFF